MSLQIRNESKKIEGLKWKEKSRQNKAGTYHRSPLKSKKKHTAGLLRSRETPRGAKSPLIFSRFRRHTHEPYSGTKFSTSNSVSFRAQGVAEESIKPPKQDCWGVRASASARRQETPGNPYHDPLEYDPSWKTTVAFLSLSLNPLQHARTPTAPFSGRQANSHARKTRNRNRGEKRLCRYLGRQWPGPAPPATSPGPCDRSWCSCCRPWWSRHHRS